MFFEFHHNFYDADGKNFAHCEMMGAWIDLKERKLTALPQVFLDAFDALFYPVSFYPLPSYPIRSDPLLLS